MELKVRIWRQLLVVSLALNLGFVYRDYSNGKHKHDLSCENECKNSCSGFAERAVFEAKSSVSDDEIIDVDLGDPTMYEKYWQQMGGKTTVVIPGWRFMSYVSDVKNICFFLEPEFANAVVRLHKLVGNAVTQDRFIVVGTGSTQLIQAVLYATSPRNSSEPVSVVSAAPYYSAYPFFANYLKSGLYEWGGDARDFKGDGRYTEIVTSPNNPDGSLREAVVSSKQGGILIHDLAYYWPQYTSISSPADHDIMLFTVSKCTGHAGTRLGWALVKDKEIAKKMAEFMVINSAGVSKDSQIRGAKILQVVVDTHEHNRSSGSSTKLEVERNAFFEHSYNLMAKRWRLLSSAVNRGKIFSLPRFPAGKCAFSGRTFATQPAFAWVKCEGEIDDCERFLRENYKILSKGGKQFGDSPKYARISVMPRDHVFEQLVDRLSTIHSSL
ncbi:tryptophan aminotransferase-related protein 2-like [Henckelia pumila]|uniref:tryptophan aminotransferase-related protein 2-like n=1 Tax=Henckelia pumila TaxID=405737 RepID=UPI003C6E3575